MVEVIEPKKTVVGNMPCDSCGAEADVKVNVKGGCYYVCTNIVRPEAQGNRQYCWHRANFSSYASEEIKQNYLEGKALENVEKNEIEQTSGATDTSGGSTDNAGAAARDNPEQPRRYGIIRGLGHFLTGDE
tara:strand:+ start:5572 stop:5964 length:393 start_codon:yes stop_codon:yes gene_type:complete